MTSGDRGPPIRDAATLVVVDRSTPTPRILMGRRRPDQVFLPNKFVFPGGRVDADDARAPSVDEPDAAEAQLLALPRAGHEPYPHDHVRALALAAIRELYEETGLVAGVRSTEISDVAVPTGWTAFLRQGVLPRLRGLHYILRAITPTARPRRYDTRFFLMEADEIVVRTAVTDDELSEIGWYSVDALDDLDVPSITRMVIRELRPLLACRLAPARDRRVPFYFEQDNVLQRAELSLAEARP